MFNPELFNTLSKYALDVKAINLGQGIPEGIFEDEINQILDSLKNRVWQYTDPRGSLLLREAIAMEYNRQCDSNQVLVTSGGTESLYVAVQAIRNTYGNKIAYFEPFYPCYLGLSELLGMHVSPLKMNFHDGKFMPDLNLLSDFAKNGGRIFVLNSPHNPTGWVMTQNELEQIIQLIDKYGMFLIIDDAYRRFVYSTDSATVDSLLNNKNVLICGSASKLLSATGLRIGWLLGNKDIINDAFRYHLYTTYCQPLAMQEIVTQVLQRVNNDASSFITTIKHYINKRDFLLQLLIAAGFDCGKPDGGHFIMARHSKFNQQSSIDFAKYMAKIHGVLPMPAEPFYISEGGAQFLRFSFSVPMNKLITASNRLSNLIT